MNDSNNLRNFELLLKKNTTKRPSALYNTTNNKNTTIKPQDVLNSVYSQIKTIQLADGKSSKISKDMKAVKSSFLAVNKLPVCHEAAKPINTFETQCVSDTQLINFIEDAEALIDTHKGMTQEFDTDFTQNNQNNTVILSQDKTDKENMVVTQEFETTFTQTNVDETVSFLHDKSERDATSSNDNIQLDDREMRDENHKTTDLLRHDKVIEEGRSPITLLHIVKTHIESSSNNEWSMDKNPGNINEDTVNKENEMSDYKEIANSIIMLKDAMEIDNIEERSPSPVLKMKTKSKTETKSLVVPLESFERFERIAIPLIDRNNDFDTCKHLINSQILGGELCLNTDEDLILHDNCQLSPIIKKSCEIIQNNSENDPIIRKSIETNLENIKDANEQSDRLKDEILFSSDEENDFIYREFQDMPLTAALDTSFCDHSDVLEETMYVGFQTASNKSIQIGTNSFQKARFMLDEDDNINGKDFSLAELVEICDEKSINNVSSADLKVQEKPKGMLVANIDSDKSQIKLDDDFNQDEEMIEDHKEKVPKAMDFSDTIKKPPEKQCFVGFKTASNKMIDLSDIALNNGKKVFKDIDFDEEFDSVDHNNLENGETKVKAKDNIIAKLDENVTESDLDDKINDDLIIQEFENIEMSLEEKEKCHGENNTKLFLGFKTASNRKIDISDAAKVKIKDIFQDIDLGEIDETEELNVAIKKFKEMLPQKLSSEKKEKKVYPELSFNGFKTANNKNISISAQALSNTKNIFQDIDKDVSNSVEKLELKKEIQTLDYRNQPSTSKKDFVGFKTANNKDIRISEVALSKSSKIFQDIDKYNPDDIEKEADTPKRSKTASNKNFILPEQQQALLQSRKLFQDIEGVNEKNIQDLNKKFKDSEHFSGFKTANDKAVAISKESIAESTKLFKDSDININQNVVALEISKNILQDIDDKLQTASNKEVAIYKETGANKNPLGELHESTTFVGFKTASNKKVGVSEKALARCKKIFEDLDDLATNNITNEKTTVNYYKPDEVSKDALERKESISNDIKVLEVKEYTFKGFQTASKKKVEVSKEALQKTKNIFKDIEESDLKEHISFKGFRTASKKEVVVSKEVMAKTKGLFNDIEMSEIKEHTFKGFQTASSKKVNVSEQAIAKSKKIFQDIDANTYDEDDNKKSNNNTVKVSDKSLFSYQNVDVSEDALKKLRVLHDSNDATKSVDDITQDKNKPKLQKDVKLSIAVNLDNILNTQVLNNFDESLCTEDFKETPNNNKRSGSPILSCPRAKKRKKFEIPYKDEKDKITKNVNKKTENITCTKEVKFKENYKKNKVYKLKELNLNNGKRTDIDPYITNFSLENLLKFEFAAHRNELTHIKIDIEELKRIFISAVNKNLVPEGWLDNHIKLILWKLISYEIKFQNGGFLCTVQNVIDQLKYRYDKELYNAERSSLRKVFEKDDVPSKTMVLCVAGIYYIDGVSVSSATNSKEVELLLTDGWYFIKCTIDKMLSKLVYDCRILVGSKIVTSGAELVNCQGVSPWEDTSAVRLKIFGNSTRPAPWHSKLGYTRGAILSQLSTVKVDGGKVCRLKVYVTRVYPMLFVEKFEDGSTVTRSERLEHLHQIKYEAERELLMERIYEEVQKDFSEQESQDSEILESGKRKYYESGSQIAKMMKLSKDPMEFRAHLTTSQVQLLQDHTCKYREKLLQAIENRLQDQIHCRNVVTLARGRIATIDNKMAVTKGMLSIWKPNEAIMELFQEGSSIEIMNTVPTAMRYSEIQITAGRQSVFRPTKNKKETVEHQSLKRMCYKISDVTNNPTMTTDYNEIDTVGMVFLIEPSHREFESNRNFQNAYITDADKNIICVNFWGGVKKFGFENILDTGQIVACANLLKRAGNTRKNIPQFRVTEFTHFTKTPKNLQAREIVDDLNKKLFGLDRRKFCDDCTAIKSNYTAIKCFNNSENESPYRFNNSDYSFARNKMFIDTPQGFKPNRNEDMNLNLTGLDFESSFKHETQELSPKTMLRKKKVNEKIAKLKMYGEPPPLTAINIINKSLNAKKSYQSPLISVNSAATVNELPQESPKARITSREKSPVISVKRTYIRSVPVKLNFIEDKSVDHFAEEFDASPPLSLD